jgi:hypothetical protein
MGRLFKAKRFRLLAALVAGEAYSMYATFLAGAVRPPSVYVVDRHTHRRLPPGQIGHIEELFHWNDVIQILVVSLLIFALVWFSIQIAVKWADERGRRVLLAPTAKNPKSSRVTRHQPSTLRPACRVLTEANSLARPKENPPSISAQS